MPNIPTIFEQELRNHTPAPLDAQFLDRLTACAEGTFTELSDGDEEFESLLGAVNPRPLPSALQASLAATLDGTPFAVDEKIVLFHGSAKAGHGKSRDFRRFNIAAAAAVALLGAAAAFMVPQANRAQTAERVNPPASGTVSSANVAPAAYGRNLSETRDEGVIWHGKNQPHRVWRFTHMENVTTTNADGETIRIQRPHYEYVVIPEKID